ncbi:unnamed protein product [Thelazia callipaeda]|uniref:Protein kinase domain-containing protein n=1 Tax=Thelazia callipaeda TaxID=103827 RepID=A0A0N5D416_THECL|nr:unnamed protein product [Thelazia callipaeda]
MPRFAGLMIGNSIESEVWKKYTRIKKIGEGTYGVVFKAMDRCTGDFVAVKKIRTNVKLSGGLPYSSIREITFLKSLVHPNIVSLKDILVNESQVDLVFEFIDMDLKMYISNIPSGKWMEKVEQKLFLYQILQGICYCHQRSILHRDLKPSNLLVDGKGGIKIADFGLGKTSSQETCLTREVCTLFYKPPEILLGENRYTGAIDIWSIGCIAAEMATKKVLFMGDSEIDQIFRIFSLMSTPNENTWRGCSKLRDYSESFPQWKQNQLDEILIHFMDADGIKIVQVSTLWRDVPSSMQMLIYNPQERITAKELLKSSYFDDIDRKKLLDSKYDGTLVLP